MSALSKKSYELFAQSVAKGVTLREAAVLAGYSPTRAQITGSELAKNSKVMSRINELRVTINESVALVAAYSVRDAIAEANEALNVARKKKNAGQMVAAVTLKAKLAGLLIERKSIELRNITELSDAELDALIASAEANVIEHEPYLLPH